MRAFLTKGQKEERVEVVLRMLIIDDTSRSTTYVSQSRLCLSVTLTAVNSPPAVIASPRYLTAAALRLKQACVTQSGR